MVVIISKQTSQIREAAACVRSIPLLQVGGAGPGNCASCSFKGQDISIVPKSCGSSFPGEGSSILPFSEPDPCATTYLPTREPISDDPFRDKERPLRPGFSRLPMGHEQPGSEESAPHSHMAFSQRNRIVQ